MGRMSDPDERLRDFEHGDADAAPLDPAGQWVPEPVVERADEAIEDAADDSHDELDEEIDRAGD